MKSLMLFVVIVMYLYPHVYSQREWAPIASHWHYTYGDIWGPPVEYLRMESVKDTVVGEKNCRLLRSTIVHDTTSSQMAQSHYEDIILYQDGYQVYRWVEEKFRILYDFSLGVGDTLEVFIPADAPFMQNTQDSIAYLRVDSIADINLSGEIFKSQYLNALEIGVDNYAVGLAGWVYESIGSRNYFLPTYGILCDLKCPWPLRCYTSETFSHKWFDIPCDTIVPLNVGIRTLSQNQQLQVYPNPAQNLIQIEYSGSKQIKLDMFDMFGKRIYNQKIYKAATIDVRHLPRGLYTIQTDIGVSKKVLLQ